LLGFISWDDWVVTTRHDQHQHTFQIGQPFRNDWHHRPQKDRVNQRSRSKQEQTRRPANCRRWAGRSAHIRRLHLLFASAPSLALAHVIIRERLYDQEFIAKWTVAFEEFSEYVQDKTPKWAETITSVSATKIERIAHELATTKPACIDAWSGPGHHSNGVEGGRASARLAALLGSFDRPGTLMLSDRRGEKHIDLDPEDSVASTLKQPRFDELSKYALGHSSGVYCQMFENLAES
jgi:Molybdopterin oxidoreductase